MNQMAMLEMLKDRVQQMEGGRRRRVGRPRKRRGGEIDGYEMSIYEGAGLVGGRRRVGRPRKTHNMPAGLKAFWDKQNRKRRGGALVGGSAEAQELYEEALMRGSTLSTDDLALLKAGIKPVTKKQLLMKRIQAWEKKLKIPMTSTERLKKITIAGLGELLEIYVSRRRILADPPFEDYRDKYGDEDRFEDPSFAPKGEQFDVDIARAYRDSFESGRKERAARAALAAAKSDPSKSTFG